MGGSVALTLRTPNGKEHRMCRSTGILGPNIDNLKFLEKDANHIERMISDWDKMNQEYSKGAQGSESYKSFVSHPHLAPHGYGLVVIDMVQNKILDYQDYHAIGEIDALEIRKCLRNCSTLTFGKRGGKKETLDDISEDDSLALVRFKRLFEAGRIKKAINAQNGMEYDLSSTQWEALMQRVESSRDLVFPIDITPFTITRYDPMTALVQMRKDIQNLGFRLSYAERSIWDAHTSYSSTP